MSGTSNDAETPAWLRAAEEEFARSSAWTEDRIANLCSMGRGVGGLSGGERDYLRMHWRRYRETARLLPDGAPGRLLDVGCYPGHLALVARLQGWRVSGLSLPGENWGDPGFEQRLRTAGIDLAATDVQRQPFPYGDGTFDAAFFCETIEHLALNPYHPLDEIWRVLKPGGALVLSTPNQSRFDLRLAMLRGTSIHPSLENPLGETFPADLANRHIREYTPGEVRYLLEGQDKYLYQFEIDRWAMDRGWDNRYCRADGVVRDRRRLNKATVLRDLVTRFVKSVRGNILVRARRPANRVCVPLDGSGFYPVEDTGTGSGFVRLPIRAAWMGRTATVRFRPPRGLVRHLDLYLLLPAPASVGARRVRAQTPAGPHELQVPVSAEPRRFRLPIGTAADGNTPMELRLETDPWRPAEHGLASDSRELGVMVGLDRAAVDFQ